MVHTQTYTDSKHGDVVKADSIKHEQEPFRAAPGGGSAGVTAGKKRVNEVTPTPTPPSGNTTESDEPPGGFSPHVPASIHASPFSPMAAASGRPPSLPLGDTCGGAGDVAAGTMSRDAVSETLIRQGPTQQRPRDGKGTSHRPSAIANVGKKSTEGQETRFAFTPLSTECIVSVYCDCVA